jgi:plasmid stability protein
MEVLSIRNFPKELGKRVKAQAAMEERPLRELVIEALELYLKADKNQNNKRKEGK